MFAMDIPQSSDLGSVYEEEAAVDSSNICTRDLPPRNKEMYGDEHNWWLLLTLVLYLLYYILLFIQVNLTILCSYNAMHETATAIVIS